MQAAKTYLERKFEEFPSCDVDALLQHGLKVYSIPPSILQCVHIAFLCAIPDSTRQFVELLRPKDSIISPVWPDDGGVWYETCLKKLL